jgi:site-specific DNA-cytosine methylase
MEQQSKLNDGLLLIMASDAQRATLAARACHDVGEADRRGVREILEENALKIKAAKQQGDVAAKKAVRAMLKPMYGRESVTRKVGTLAVRAADSGPDTFHAWLSQKPHRERLRSMARCNRMLQGIAKWKLSWMTGRGVVCVERALGRIKAERAGSDGSPEVAFMRGLVKTKELPTLTGNAGNHYVVLARGKEPRFMTVEEVARGYMVPRGPLLRMLRSTVLTEAQAVGHLGNAVHVGVARQLVRHLVERGSCMAGLRYGSAFSGIDSFAAAVDAELEGAFAYVFASEKEKVARKALLAAWGGKGLREERCYWDACSEEATGEEPVDLMLVTAECDAHSPANHDRNEGDQRSSLGSIWKSLGYVRLRRPKVVVVENVCEASIVGPLTAMLERIEGYSLETGALDPRVVARAPMARMRQFWVLERESAS